MNETIQAALAYLTAEEARLREISLKADNLAADAKTAAEDADEEWRECRDALRALSLHAGVEPEVQF